MADDSTLKRAYRVLNAFAFRTDEFGETVLIESAKAAGALKDVA